MMICMLCGRKMTIFRVILIHTKKKKPMSEVYIIDIYQEYVDNSDVRYIFSLNGNLYCIKAVELDWGKPKLHYILDDDYIQFHYYETFEEAYAFAQQLRKQEGI